MGQLSPDVTTTEPMLQRLCSSTGESLGAAMETQCSKKKIDKVLGNSMVVQWLGLHTSTAGDSGSIPGQGTKILETG